jgi:RNA polymerase subunit RPABC4/transcription elongation factor Spt4
MAATCEECGAFVPDEDCRMHREWENFWGAPCSYTVIDAYVCPECGYRWGA